jgi:hypothetical protein
MVNLLALPHIRFSEFFVIPFANFGINNRQPFHPALFAEERGSICRHASAPEIVIREVANVALDVRRDLVRVHFDTPILASSVNDIRFIPVSDYIIASRLEVRY